MQINDLIFKYVKVGLERDRTDSENCFPLDNSPSFRIYYNEVSRTRKSYDFIAHGHDYGSTAEIILLYKSGISIRVHSGTDVVELFHDSGDISIVKSADEYFNLALSLELTVPYSLLQELQSLACEHKSSVTLYMSEIIENVQQN